MTKHSMRVTRVALMILLSLFLASCGKDKDKGDKGLGAKTGGVPTSAEGQMYALGQKLSQAAMVNGRAAPDVVDRTFKAASTIAKITLSTELEPLPATTGDRAKDGAAGMGYLLNEQGKKL